jgi:hypothetical protein
MAPSVVMQSSITTYLSWLVGEVDEAAADEVLTLMTPARSKESTSMLPFPS